MYLLANGCENLLPPQSHRQEKHFLALSLCFKSMRSSENVAEWLAQTGVCVFRAEVVEWRVYAASTSGQVYPPVTDRLASWKLMR